jgi:hypothetical protein
MVRRHMAWTGTRGPRPGGPRPVVPWPGVRIKRTSSWANAGSLAGSLAGSSADAPGRGVQVELDAGAFADELRRLGALPPHLEAPGTALGRLLDLVRAEARPGHAWPAR